MAKPHPTDAEREVVNELQAQEIVRRVALAMHDPERVVKNPSYIYEEGGCRACVYGHMWQTARVLNLSRTPAEDKAEKLVDSVAVDFTFSKIDRETAAARLDEIVARF